MELLFKTVKKKETVQQVRKQDKEEVKAKVEVDPKVRIQQLLEGKLPEFEDRTLEDRVEEARKLVEKVTKMTAEVCVTLKNGPLGDSYVGIIGVPRLVR